jgi:hypothetical protein
MPLLEAMHALIKFAHAPDCFVYDFIIFVNMCCVKLYNMYYNMEKKYIYEQFKVFLDLHEGIYDKLFATWWTNPTTNIQFVVFHFMGKQYMMHKRCPLTVVFTQAMQDD